MSWSARYRGVCTECGVGFEPDTEITYTRPGESPPIGARIDYRHAPTCPTDDAAPTRFEGTTLEQMGF